MALQVGELVRVALKVSGPDQRSSRARVSFINDDDGGSIDLVYQAPEWAGGMEEEAGVAPVRLSRLLPFETGAEERQGDGSTRSLKQQGDQLFGLHDHEAALERYSLALEKLVPPLRVGTAVLVRKAVEHEESEAMGHQGYRHRRATVADISSEGCTVDVIYDDDDTRGEEEEEEEDGVAMERVAAVAGGRGREEQVRILLNMARCHLNGTAARVDQAMAAVTMALALLLRTGGEEDEEEDQEASERMKKLLPSAYRVCCVAYMRAQDWRRAKHCAALLSRLPGQAETGQRLVQEVERSMARRQQENKRLVKDMSRWIDKAVKTQGEGTGGEEQAGHETQEGESCSLS